MFKIFVHVFDITDWWIPPFVTMYTNYGWFPIFCNVTKNCQHSSEIEPYSIDKCKNVELGTHNVRGKQAKYQPWSAWSGYNQ